MWEIDIRCRISSFQTDTVESYYTTKWWVLLWFKLSWIQFPLLNLPVTWMFNLLSRSIYFLCTFFSCNREDFSNNVFQELTEQCRGKPISLILSYLWSKSYNNPIQNPVIVDSYLAGIQCCLLWDLLYLRWTMMKDIFPPIDFYETVEDYLPECFLVLGSPIPKDIAICLFWPTRKICLWLHIIKGSWICLYFTKRREDILSFN